MSMIHYQKDQDKIVHLIIDVPELSANQIDDSIGQSLVRAIERLTADDFDGVIICSAKETFVGRSDLNSLIYYDKTNARSLFDTMNHTQQALRQLETLKKPVVCCIKGNALGPGLEFALAAHYRICVQSEQISLGLPEVELGLMPGAGGVSRMVRMFGLKASMPYLLEGTIINPQKALDMGLVDELVDHQDMLYNQAKKWIQANPSPIKCWDKANYVMPGGSPDDQEVAQTIAITPAILSKKTAGCLPAPGKIFSAMVEGAQVDFDTACQIETSYFVEQVCSPITKNLINTFWFGNNKIQQDELIPKEYQSRPINQVGIIGAGMMGSGIAYTCAKKGINVILKDTHQKIADKGKLYSARQLSKVADKEAILSLITPTDQTTELANCDLIIEAVYENRLLKESIIHDIEPLLKKDAIFATNTSTLPVTGLAENASRPESFIGLHFFSPVEKMKLVEIIKGKKTSKESLYRSIQFVRRIGKIPILVNDSRGFFTSRVFATFINEGIAMLGAGVSAASIENAAALAGFPVGPLAVTDEVSLTLIEKIRRQTVTDSLQNGEKIISHPADSVIDRMIEIERPGKLEKAGFYEYPFTGKKHLWSGLSKLFYQQEKQLSVETIKQRLLYIMAIESVRCLEEKVVTRTIEVNIGSIYGIGFPTWTGGTLEFINYVGLKKFVQNAKKLASRFGERFEPPAILVKKSQQNERF